MCKGKNERKDFRIISEQFLKETEVTEEINNGSKIYV
jgi:hypothetical protein